MVTFLILPLQVKSYKRSIWISMIRFIIILVVTLQIHFRSIISFLSNELLTVGQVILGLIAETTKSRKFFQFILKIDRRRI